METQVLDRLHCIVTCTGNLNIHQRRSVMSLWTLSWVNTVQLEHSTCWF